LSQVEKIPERRSFSLDRGEKESSEHCLSWRKSKEE
jgi:hypothetical protein